MANWVDRVLKWLDLKAPKLPDYDPQEYAKAHWGERVRLGCIAWAQDGYGAPLSLYGLYLLKILAYVAGWVFFCTFSPGMGGVSDIHQWAFTKTAFQKAIIWSLAFEGLGLGCSSGPLSGRYLPPLGGVLYFLRLGTLKLSLVPTWPIFGGMQRRWADIILYVSLYSSLFFALLSPEINQTHAAFIVVCIAFVGLADKTIFLCLRAEHYGFTTVCFLFPQDWIAGACAVQIALWWWAAVSKLNSHFPAVMAVMSSNHPIIKSQWIRRRMYADFPTDLRPSRLAHHLAHAGTLLEFSVPILLILGDGGSITTFGLLAMVALHGYIASNFPMAVPIEWNVMIVYGSFFLFGTHAHVSLTSIQAPLLIVILTICLFIIPLVGHLVPRWVSFLTSMRYYAGNWAFGVWLFRQGAFEKLSRNVVMVSQHPKKQLARIYDEETARHVLEKVIAFRAMHLHGRILQPLLPLAVESIDDYEYADGEIIAGLVLGWNFGDGHLHHEQLLKSIQNCCGFTEGELRCIFIESQPLFRAHHDWRIVDACSGLIARGRHSVDDLTKRQPWPQTDDEGFRQSNA